MNNALRALTIGDVLKWADQHHEWTGRWPMSRSGTILGQSSLTWEAINTALRKGGRGLPGGSSLARLLHERRNVVDPRRVRPDLTAKQIAEWAQNHRMLTGRWPERDSGAVIGARDISWSTIDRTLKRGGSNLPGGSSLIDFLRDAFGVWTARGSRRLTHSLILKWADDHYARTGRWPVVLSGKVHRYPQETWAAINEALRHGRRGLPGGTTLMQLLLKHRGAAYDPSITQLTVERILAWAGEYFRIYGRWPTARSGKLSPARTTWSTIDRRLREGGQGLPGGSSLHELLESQREPVQMLVQSAV